MDGRLLAMLEDVEPLTLDFLNRATQAWVEGEYNRSDHEELGCPPLTRLLEGPDVSRPAPDAAALRLAFTLQETRTQRRSDGTVSIGGVRFEVPSRFRHLRTLVVRYQSFDLGAAWLVDERTGEPVSRLLPQDKARNAEGTVQKMQPLLLILDPFVRLHRINENASAEVVPLLATLRDLQRTYGCAILIVHHSKKGASGVRAGQALRGSSEFHAWADAGLFMQRRGDDIVLSTEHRANPSIQDLKLRLDTTAGNVALVVADQPAEVPTTPHPVSPADSIIAALKTCATPLSARQLRQHCSIRTSTVADRSVRSGSARQRRTCWTDEN